MSGFTRNINLEFEFDGDTIKATLARLKREDMQQLAPYIDRTDGVEKVKFADYDAMLEVGAAILKKRLVSFEGLTGEGGAAVSLDEALAEVYFQPVILRLFAELINSGTVPDPKAPAGS